MEPKSPRLSLGNWGGRELSRHRLDNLSASARIIRLSSVGVRYSSGTPISFAQTLKIALNYGRSITYSFSKLRQHSLYYQ